MDRFVRGLGTRDRTAGVANRRPSERGSISGQHAGRRDGRWTRREIVSAGPCPQSRGNPVTFISYPKISHDFDVQGGYSGVVKEAQVFTKCDVVVDLSNGHILRLNHADNPKTTPEEISSYPKSCMTHGPTVGLQCRRASQCGPAR